MPPLRRPGMRKAKLVFLLLFFLAGSLATSPAPAQKVPQVQPPKSDTADLPKIELEKYKLTNGLEVILSEHHSLPMVAVNLWYDVGQANEIPGRSGFVTSLYHCVINVSKLVR